MEILENRLKINQKLKVEQGTKFNWKSIFKSEQKSNKNQTLKHKEMSLREHVNENINLQEGFSKSEIKLNVNHICKQFDGEDILKDISFQVKKGEFLAILGLSGCGKTTLLRILIGLEKQDSGSIQKDGNEISMLAPNERGMGIIFQNYALFPNMTVLENVAYALKLKKETKAKATKIAEQTLDQIGMSEHLNKKPSQLSGGQQQRVAIARTLAMNPDIILLDEPISALDVTNREIMKRELKEIQKKFQSTMIFITHEQEEAFYLADRIMVMSEGRMEQLDTPENIYAHPANQFVEEFVVAHLEQKYQSLLKCTGRK